VETAECWEAALLRRNGPSSMVCSRQALPPLRAEASENQSARRAYVLAETEAETRRVTLLATGSDVALAMQARTLLEADGIATAVVSMPCWELFEAQDPDYQCAVLGEGTRRVVVEAAVQQGWDRWIGERCGFIGMSSFGASGTPDDLFRHFGITVESIVQKVRDCLRSAARFIFC
jgi:transketolase